MKVLVIRFSAMGDIVLTSPVLRLLSNELNADISFLTKDKYAGLLKHNPYVNHILTLSTSVNETIRLLKVKNFDLIIDLNKNVLSKRISLGLGIRSLVYDKRTIEKFRILSLRHRHINASSVADRYVDALSPLGIENDGLGLDFFIPQGINTKGAISNEKKNIAVVAGGTYLTKRIPNQIISDLIKNDDWNFQLLGGRDIGGDIAMLESKNCYNGIGKLSLNESASIIRDTDIVVTGDTGLMHIAAAFQKPIIVIWGSTATNFGFSPYYGFNSKLQFKSIARDLRCRPCSKYGRKQCPLEHMNCLNTIQASEVSLAIKELLR
ncbi:MAG: ADP-heptose:LPS heptosyltransferase [Saprospiraceae bacterium]|jgi:ADP-heptose:LPS heptosyltransferase